MNEKKEMNSDSGGLRKHLSPLAVWALAFGCAVGWGAFVMPGTTFLPIGGPRGMVIGMAVGAFLMWIIGVNYSYMMERHPDAGGTYTFTKESFGYDYGFLSAWFIVLVYVAIAWANMTALPLIFRNLFGDIFQFGFHYTVVGYDVYFGEALLSIAALLIFGLVSIYGGRTAARVQTVLALILVAGVLIGIIAAFAHSGMALFDIQPPYSPDRSSFSAVFGVASLAPWAFVGFESISHSAEEFNFSTKKSFKLITIAVVTGALAYVLLTILAVSAVPEGYASWVEYIGDIGNLKGLSAIPTFHAVDYLMGNTGLIILMITLLAAVATGLLGNSIAASRLMISMSRDGVLSPWFGRISDRGTPKNAILFIMLISIPVAFLGRTATGWIVDVNTIGATIAYACTSASAYKKARAEGHRKIMATGLAGLAISVIFFVYFMVPNFWLVSAMGTESYLILIAWSILGFLFFRVIFKRDTKRRFGQSTVVWFVLLFLIFFASMLWFRETTHDATHNVVENIEEYSIEEIYSHGVDLDEEELLEVENYLNEQHLVVEDTLTRNSLIQMFLITLSLLVMFGVYSNMLSREKKMEAEKKEAEQNNLAKSTFLSNMSHDLRTPMNAIIGYTGFLKKEEGLSEKGKDYLEKIEASSGHLLALINDVLEMSRIESGKMELEIERTDLNKLLGETYDLFATQMETKNIKYTVEGSGLEDKIVFCDKNRLNRVLLNLISNAYKFTPEGGSVAVVLKEEGRFQASEVGNEAKDFGRYTLSVKDSGIGMSPEFAAKVFEAYSRDRSVSKIQGTGLGMAITKNIVGLMGGSIDVLSELGKGTEFIVHLDFELSMATESGEAASAEEKVYDFSGLELLLVDDIDLNREIAQVMLEEAGFVVDTAENGKEAVDKVAKSGGKYRVVLMDVQMPVMNGYEATKAIRELSDPKLSKIPIIALTANAFREDIENARAAGMDGHLAKPIIIEKMMETLAEVLG